MSSIQSLKAPSLVSKKTQKEIQKDDDDVMIDPSALPTRVITTTTTSNNNDTEMDEDKPNFAPATASETVMHI